MTLAITPAPSRPDARTQFEDALPAIESTLNYHFRRLTRDRREDMVGEALAATWSFFRSLARRGKDPVEIGIRGIAGKAALYVAGGRRVGNRSTGLGCMDIQHPRVRRDHGLRVVALEDLADATDGSWVEWLGGDHRVSPADDAAFRVDFRAWLDGLPARKRRIAELLADGYSTGAAAELLHVSPSAVSQSRTWLEASWRDFQGADVVTDAAPARRPRGRPRKDAVTRRRS